MADVPTRKVRYPYGDPDARDYAIINAADFDPAVHEDFVEPATDAAGPDAEPTAAEAPARKGRRAQKE